MIENQPGKVSAVFECVEASVFPIGNKWIRMLPMMHWMVDSRAGFLFLLVVAFVVAAITYAIPIFLAWTMGSPYLTAITLLDLLLGWTILGWIAALIWRSLRVTGVPSMRMDHPGTIPRSEPPLFAIKIDASP